MKARNVKDWKINYLISKLDSPKVLIILALLIN